MIILVFWKEFQVQNGKSEHHHPIFGIWISVGTSQEIGF